MKNFIHLHLHSEYSLLDSNLKIKPAIKRVGELNMPAVALTDHGSILGAVSFFKEAKDNGIKPIIGAELYVAPGSIKDRPKKNRGEINYHHLIALVKNQTGYRNLSELITLSFTKGFYRKPRIDRELLKNHHEGLVILSACLQGEIAYNFRHDRGDEAVAAARWYHDLFKDDYYIELMNHNLADQVKILPELIRLSEDLSIPHVVTNDVHYLSRPDSDARDILICLQTNEVLSNPERPMRKETDEMYLKSYAEMMEVFPEMSSGFETTVEIASKCNFEFQLGKYFLPEFKVPDEETVDGYFEKICWDGYGRIKKSLDLSRFSLDDYEKRLRYEIEKIREMGFPGYFLIVWDIIRFSREKGISVGPGRGSVVGSFVSFVMGITTVNPLTYDLIFERFLNPERISMPDIDIDFDGERRDEVIEYIREKYGKDNVAQIVTFGKMKAKLAIRDIGRVQEIPLSKVDRLAKLIPDGPKVRLEQEIKENTELQKEIKQNEETKFLIDSALKLENNIRHTSMHAAGVVIAPKKLTEYMPLYKTKDDIVTQFEKTEVEEVGLLKMDILGLKTLTIIKNILVSIEEIERKEIDLDLIPLDDKKTFKIFQKGETDGIFQFESSGMREYLKRSKPGKIEDLIVLNGLYRPGPLGSGMADAYVNRKLGKEKVSNIFPQLEEILRDTFGIIVFQEQVMRILVAIGGFSMSKADEMRKIMGKKLTQKIPAMKKDFFEGALRRNFQKKKVEELFAQMETFAEYGFNKSHSTAYALLAYQTAYLKAHYPVYFMCANLSSEAEKTSTSSKMIEYISESKKIGINILPPNINCSFENFRVESPQSIRFGLIGLKNVGESAICSILKAREEEGEFSDYADLFSKIDPAKVNKAVLESMIKAGAFDCFGLKRSTLFDSLEEILRQSALITRKALRNQKSLFSSFDSGQIAIPQQYLEQAEWSEHELIQKEREITGIYVTINPVDRFKEEIAKVSNATVSIINNGGFKGDMVKIGGVFNQVKQRKSRKGEFYGELFFEDLTGRIKVFAFKDRWEKVKDTLKMDFPYYLEGRIPENGDTEQKIYLESLLELESAFKRRARKILININYKLLNKDFTGQLREKLAENKDSVPYIIVVTREDGYRTIINSDSADGLKPTSEMKNDIETLTGPGTVEILF